MTVIDPSTAGPPPSGTSVIGLRGAASVSIASVISAASGYLVFVVAARSLSPVQNADFLVYWAVLFTFFAVLGGVQQELTRAVGSDAGGGAAGREPRSRALLTALAFGAGVAAVAAVAVSLWISTAATAPMSRLSGVVTVAAVIAYSGHAAVVGILSGQRRWLAASVVIAGEATLRLIFVIVAAVGGGVEHLQVAVAASAGFWLLALVLRPVRNAARVRLSVPARQTAILMASAAVAGVGYAVVVVGFPTLLRITTDDQSWRSAAPLLLAISLTRAPLLIPLAAFQGVLIAYFLHHRDLSGALRGAGMIALVGLVGAGLAFVFGPSIMAAFFGDSYRVSGWLLAALVLAASVLAALTVTSSAVLAMGQHRTYAVGWLIAIFVSVWVLFMPASLETRAVLALVLGPATATAFLLRAVLRRRSLSRRQQ